MKDAIARLTLMLLLCTCVTALQIRRLLCGFVRARFELASDRHVREARVLGLQARARVLFERDERRGRIWYV